MLNFIIEKFDCNLEQMVYVQRLFMSIIKETLEEYGEKAEFLRELSLFLLRRDR